MRRASGTGSIITGQRFPNVRNQVLLRTLEIKIDVTESVFPVSARMMRLRRAMAMLEVIVRARFELHFEREATFSYLSLSEVPVSCYETKV